MNERWVFSVTMFAIVGAGLVAGVFFVFSNFLMKVLDQRPPGEAVATMQTLNQRIENPLFLLLFMGTALAGGFLAVYALVSLDGPERTWLIVGGVSYVVGAALMTFAYHLPRNHELDRLDPGSAEVASRWSSYLSEWMPAHHIRTLAATVSFASFVMAVRVG